MPDPLEVSQLLINAVKDHEKKLDMISHRLETIITRLENVEKKWGINFHKSSQALNF